MTYTWSGLHVQLQFLLIAPLLYLGQVVREHYLRDDIQSGSPLDPRCDPEAAKLAADAPHYLVVDTNIVLQQVPPSMLRTIFILMRIEDRRETNGWFNNAES